MAQAWDLVMRVCGALAPYVGIMDGIIFTAALFAFAYYWPWSMLRRRYVAWKKSQEKRQEQGQSEKCIKSERRENNNSCEWEAARAELLNHADDGRQDGMVDAWEKLKVVDARGRIPPLDVAKVLLSMLKLKQHDRASEVAVDYVSRHPGPSNTLQDDFALVMQALANTGAVGVAELMLQTLRKQRPAIEVGISLLYHIAMGHAILGQYAQLRATVDSMRRGGGVPLSVYTSAVGVHLKNKAVRAAFEFIYQALKDGHQWPSGSTDALLQHIASRPDRLWLIQEQFLPLLKIGMVVLSGDGLAHLLTIAVEHNEHALMVQIEKLADRLKVPLVYTSYDMLMRAYSKVGDPRAVQLWERCIASGCRITEETAAALLTKCAASSYVKFGETVAAYCRSRDWGRLTAPVYTTLMQMYSNAALHQKALDLLPQMESDGVQLTDSMRGSLLSVAAECGNTGAAQQLFDAIGTKAATHYMSMLKLAGKCGDAEMGLRVLGQMVEDPAVSVDTQAYNAALDCCAEARAIVAAERLFSEAPEKDGTTYNTLMKAYILKGDFRKVDLLLALMESDDSPTKADAISYNQYINALVDRNEVGWAEEVYKRMLQHGFKTDKYTSSIMVKAFSKKDQLPRLMAFIQSIDICEDIRLFCTVVDSLTRVGDKAMLNMAFQHFNRSSLRPNCHAYGSLIKACGKVGDIRTVWQLWVAMVEHHKLKPSGYTLGCMLDALASNDRMDEAEQVFASVRENCRDVLNTIHFSIMIKGFTRVQELDKAYQYYTEMPRVGLAPNEIVYNTLINAHCEAGLMLPALQIFEEMMAAPPYRKDAHQKTTQHEGLSEAFSGSYSPQSDMDSEASSSSYHKPKPDLITYSCLIKGFCKQNELDKAMLLMHSMERKGVKPDRILFNILIDGCAKFEDVSTAEVLWNRILDPNNTIVPDNYFLATIVKLFARAQRPDKALQVEEYARANRLPLNSHVISAFMNCCFRNGRLAKAVEIFETAQQSKMDLHSTIYDELISRCVKAEVYEKAFHIAQLAFARGVPLERVTLSKLQNVSLLGRPDLQLPADVVRAVSDAFDAPRPPNCLFPHGHPQMPAMVRKQPNPAPPLRVPFSPTQPTYGMHYQQHHAAEYGPTYMGCYG
ncbi:unnamed protein product [Vitrella brassicaformis CCMP3155]|uniref:Pentacotripeptide-repeat region of PRORP domain-containing protein n=1 Tax=Vitrella brassicaformis (strain CCMP3155) TaxID=1169540 RepID=A0A0G4ERD8_VITBC|nr:unnamed protein product [Vitrella brassicaformis CCMP3155]|eukprot:CEM00594.1 unnamed protein product [Vitrella brassicaformis CCMP3155]